MEELRKLLEESMTDQLYQMIASAPREKDAASKVKVRPVMLQNRLVFQISRFVGKQVLHENLEASEAVEKMAAEMETAFRQMEIETSAYQAVVLVSKKGKITVKKKNRAKESDKKIVLSHNRTKRYILEEGRPVPFLQDLGVMTQEGRIVHSRYDKFRQINRFLEFIEDIVPILPRNRQIHIIDFGCGKSYLTFAMYYYLKQLQGLDIRITGLDLKADVIANCNELAKKYGYENLEFLHGDIADYTGCDQVDMVVTLHACDTATDYALYKAICWNARVILSVPCCQHEVNSQISCEALEGALRYGLLKERLSALFTDALRADILEEQGYETQVLEFIDMEHTPKNILLRAVRRKGTTENTGSNEEKGAGKNCRSSVLSQTLNVKITLQKLLEDKKD